MSSAPLHLSGGGIERRTLGDATRSFADAVGTLVRRSPRVERPPLVLFRRRPSPRQFSMERVFDDVIAAFPPSLHAIEVQLPHVSDGIVNRLRNVVFAFGHRGRINHITGDVYYVALVLGRRSTVLTVHDAVVLNRLSGLRRWVVEMLWYRVPIWWCARVTAISTATRDDLVRRYPWSRSKIDVVANPVSPTFRPSPPRDNDPPVVLQVGTGPNKNLTRVVEGLRGLTVALRVIGRLSPEQRSLLDGSGLPWSNAVDLTVEEIAAEYERCDVVVFASTFEGFGLPVVEAQASGRPVVTSDIAPVCDTAGDGALLVDPYDPAAIGSAVHRIVTDSALRDRLVAAGLSNVGAFEPAAIAAAYIDVYRGIEPGTELPEAV